jgi:hypothetical protein
MAQRGRRCWEASWPCPCFSWDLFIAINYPKTEEKGMLLTHCPPMMINKFCSFYHLLVSWTKDTHLHVSSGDVES